MTTFCPTVVGTVMLLEPGFDASAVPRKGKPVIGAIVIARTAQQAAIRHNRIAKRRVCLRDLEDFGDMAIFSFHSSQNDYLLDGSLLI
jgi:hypothetical protein